jgi:hypothetical protein
MRRWWSPSWTHLAPQAEHRPRRVRFRTMTILGESQTGHLATLSLL